jgi:hypothetical protein
MSLRNRLGALLLAILLAGIWSVALRRDGGGAAREAPVAATAVPSRPASPPAPAKRRRRKSLALEAAEAEAARKKARGARLREKGEALGGDGIQREMARDERAAEKADRDASAQ